MKAMVFLAILAFAAVANAQRDSCVLTIEYDNRGSKVMDPKTADKILRAMAKDTFMVLDQDQVAQGGGLGQSSLFNHKSTVSYIATGPTSNGKSLCANCQAATVKPLLGLRSSKLEKSLKKATDTWMPGDSVDVKHAQCSTPKVSAGGRKMSM